MKYTSTQLKHLRSPAFAILEMLIFVVLLVAVASLATQLFVISMKAQRDSQKYEELLHRVDAAIHSLRHDVWSAHALKIDSPQTLAITLPTGETATWRRSPEGTLTRTTAGKTQSWSAFPPLSFSTRGPLLTLTLYSAPGRDESLTLISQQLAAGGAP